MCQGRGDHETGELGGWGCVDVADRQVLQEDCVGVKLVSTRYGKCLRKGFMDGRMRSKG